MTLPWTATLNLVWQLRRPGTHNLCTLPTVLPKSRRSTHSQSYNTKASNHIL